MRSRLLCLLYCALTVGAAVKVVVKTPSIQVTRGGSVRLPCSFRTTAALTRLSIIWTVSPLQQPQQPVQIIAYTQGQIVESLSHYLGRVSFAAHPTLDASIILTQSRATDTGTYLCTVTNPPDGAAPNIGLIGLTVLVPPSSPECSTDGRVQEGGSVRLQCSVTEGTPTPSIRWEKVSPRAQRVVSTQEDYLASAILTNVTSETSGLYRCTATNQLGSQTCDVDLHVRVGGLGPMGIFAAITITLIMGLVLLALFFLVLCLHQQSRGKWPGGEYRVDSVTYGQPHFAKSSSSDRTTSSRRPPHVLYCSTPDVPTMKRHWSPAPERMSSSSRHWSPAPEMMSSSSRHWSPAPERMSSSSRHWSPAPERMSSSSRHWSPAPERMSSSSSSEDSSTGNEEEGDSSPVVRSSIYLV